MLHIPDDLRGFAWWVAGTLAAVALAGALASFPLPNGAIP